MKVFRVELTDGQWDALQHEYFKYAPGRAEYETDSDIVEAALPFDVSSVEEDSEPADELTGFVRRMAD